MDADRGLPAARCRCRTSAIGQESSRIEITSMSSGGSTRWERNRAFNSAGRPATGAASFPETIGSASEEHNRKNHSPVVATPSGARPSKSGGPGQEVAKKMIVDDEGRHLHRREIRIVKAAHKHSMVLGAEGLRQESLALSRRKENHGVARVNDGHPARW
jgi:hypothetical protein